MCMCVYECFCCFHATGSHFMGLPIVRVQDWRAPCHPGWPSQICMSFMFTSCLQNVAWCCLICGMCLLLIHPFVGGRAEPGEGVCPAQSGGAWGCPSEQAQEPKRWRAQALFGLHVPEITKLLAFTQHFFFWGGGGGLCEMSCQNVCVKGLVFKVWGDLVTQRALHSGSCLVPGTVFLMLTASLV